MNLTDTTHSAEITGTDTTPLHWSADWSIIDKSGATSLSLGSSQGILSTATTVTVVAAPAANIQLKITRITVSNPSASLTTSFRVKKDVSSTEYTVDAVTLAPGRTWTYAADGAFGIVNASISPGGLSNKLQYNEGGAFAGVANVEHHDGDLAFAETSPSTPPIGTVKIFGRKIAGRHMVGCMGPSGLDTALQPFQGRNKVVTWNPIGSSATVPLSDGLIAPTVAVATARAVTVANMVTMAKRLGSSSTAVAGTSANFRSNVAQFALGPSAGLGGFTYVCRFAISDIAAVADARMFVGFSSTTTVIANVNPSTLLNFFGVATDSGQTTLHFMHNGGTGTASFIDLGANFPADTRTLDLYELAMFCPPNGNVVNYMVTRLNTGDVATGLIETDLPTGTTLLAPQIWRNNGTTALAVAIDLINLYIETDQ